MGVPNSRMKGKIAVLTAEDLHGVDLNSIRCRSCSGYGNCGFKTYHLFEDKVVSICNRRKAEEFEKIGIKEYSKNK